MARFSSAGITGRPSGIQSSYECGASSGATSSVESRRRRTTKLEPLIHDAPREHARCQLRPRGLGMTRRCQSLIHVVHETLALGSRGVPSPCRKVDSDSTASRWYSRAWVL